MHGHMNVKKKEYLPDNTTNKDIYILILSLLDSF